MIFRIRPFFFQSLVASAVASPNYSNRIWTTRSSSRCLGKGRWSKSVRMRRPNLKGTNALCTDRLGCVLAVPSCCLTLPVPWFGDELFDHRY